MNIADFTFNPENKDYLDYLDAQFKEIEKSINESKSLNLKTQFKYLDINDTNDFNDETWVDFGIATCLGVKEKALLGLGGNSPKDHSQDEVLKYYISRIIKRLTVLELQTFLLISPDQDQLEVPEKQVFIKVESNQVS